jgi:hypothetical protein
LRPHCDPAIAARQTARQQSRARPKAAARHQLDQAIIHARNLLEELQEQRVLLGGRDDERSEA